MNKYKGFNLISVIAIIVCTSVVSAITVGVIVTNSYNNKIDYKALSEDEALKEFLDVYSNITNNYYEDIDKEKMLDKAVDAMLNYLDDSYTTYLNSNERKALDDQLAGTYEGIGIEIREQTIVGVMKDTPAEKAGLQANDKILMINDTDVTDKSANYISVLIKTNKDKPINIKVLRGEEELTFNVKTEVILSKDIYTEVTEDGIGYMGIGVFSKTLKTQAINALEELDANGMKKLVIDLRGNTGGYLDAAEDLASMFLEQGKLIYSLESKTTKEDYYDKTNEKRTLPIVVLINGKSASASEILAAALKDSYGAILVGEKSFGKGKVQQTYDLTDGAMAKYTSAKWLRPSGECIDGIGITPDYIVELEEEYDEEGNLIGYKDTQLLKAFELLGTM